MIDVVRDLDSSPTFLGYSDGPVGVVAGGGIYGFGGVVVCEAEGLGAQRIIRDPDIMAGRKGTHGIILDYNDVATITVS